MPIKSSIGPLRPRIMRRFENEPTPSVKIHRKAASEVEFQFVTPSRKSPHDMKVLRGPEIIQPTA